MVISQTLLTVLEVCVFLVPALIGTWYPERYDRRKEREYEEVSEHINETLSTWHPSRLE